MVKKERSFIQFQRGAFVEFEIRKTDRGPEAVQVRCLDDSKIIKPKNRVFTCEFETNAIIPKSNSEADFNRALKGLAKDYRENTYRVVSDKRHFRTRRERRKLKDRRAEARRRKVLRKKKG